MSYPTKKLKDVCSINGGDPAPQDYAVFSSDGIPFVRMQDLGRYHVTDNLTETRDKIKLEAIKKLGVKIFSKGSIILPRSGSVFANHRAILGIDAVVVSHIAILNNYKDIQPKYLFWYLAKLDIGRHAVKTSNVDSISFQRLGKFEIPVPPLLIQKKIVERLDKIAEAQKLNDGLIQKTNELFQSLLHKELNPVRDSKHFNGVNPAGPADAKAKARRKDWEEDKFVNCIEKNPLKIKGIPREKYQIIGKFPIIDQSDKFIVGYTNNEEKVYKMDSPVIIFGDHTRIFKYVDFNFAIGADGTQIIIPSVKRFTPKFFYFLMLNLKINNLGYSRHFKLLKTKKLIIPPLDIQKQIVAKLSAVQDYKKQLLEQKSKLKELFNSALAKSMTS